MEATLEHLIFLAAHDTYMGTLLDLGYDVILEGGVDGVPGGEAENDQLP